MVTATEIYVQQISATRKALVVRDPNKDNYDSLIELRESMQRHGLIEPIIVRPVNGRGSYEVVAGNRRLEAAKLLQWSKIAAVIEEVSDLKLRRLAFVENVYREDIDEDEKAKSIAAIYQDVGLSSSEAKSLTKQLHNNPELVEPNSSPRLSKSKAGRPEASKPPANVIEAFKDIGISANRQYQYLQMIVDIDPEVREVATKKGLSMSTKLVLTHPEIRKKSKQEQKEIIDDVKHFSGAKAKQRIRQYVEAEQKKEPSPQKITDEQTRDLLKISMSVSDAVEKLIATITNRKLSRGEVFFTEEIIDSRKDQIFALIKAMGDTRQLDAFEEQMNLLDHLLVQVFKAIDQGRFSNKKQKELLRP